MRVCFDVDGTLIDYDDNPRLAIIGLLVIFYDHFDITVWSGGGQQYADHVVQKLGLWSYVDSCLAKSETPPPDTVFTVDDFAVDFGVPNLFVGPREWTDEMWAKLKDQQKRAVAINGQ